MDRIPIEKLKLTKRREESLKKMGIQDVETLLRHYPTRYENIEAIPFEQWKPGDHVSFEGVICSEPTVVRYGRRQQMLLFKVISWNQEIQVRIYNAFWKQNFSYGKTVTLFGVYKGNHQVSVSRYNFTPFEKQKGLRPVYSTSKALKQKDFEAIMKKALEMSDQFEELIPERYRNQYQLLTKSQALKQIHQPTGPKGLKNAIRTLKYEEFLCFQCVLQSSNHQKVYKQPKSFSMEKVREKISQLEYELTPDQKDSLEKILADMGSDQMMYRLLQGDVGCGKTVVAALSIYAAYLDGSQSALMAPTEILARQHVESLKKLGIPAVLYVSSLPLSEKRKILEGLETGDIPVVVGTHSLFQDGVEFKNLGFVVADEQQRFGVRQRRALLQKGKQVDFLMMSATPIPRTYANLIYGEISLSSIHTMPPGRKPAITKAVYGRSMKPFLKEFLQGIRQGKQAYVVCAAIEENEDFQMEAAEKIYEGMKKVLQDVRIGLLHGKLDNEQKDRIMQDFKNHKLDCLVSTTVIEVGIDVPNATQMVIYDAHRFGLSTLHQLRGRVARGKEQGICWLLSSSKNEQSKERLKKMEELSDGFSISRYDLETRGPGDILGTRQSGLPSFLLGDMQKDQAMMEACMNDAREILFKGVDKPMLEYLEKASLNSFYID